MSRTFPVAFQWSRIILVLVALGFFACHKSPDQQPPVLTADGLGIMPDSSGRSGNTVQKRDSGPPVHPLETQLHIYRFRILRDSNRLMEAVWQNVDESAALTGDGLALRRNGFRLGLGNLSSWPVVRALILEQNPQVWTQSVILAPGIPFTLELDPMNQAQPIFFYDHEDRLCGARFEEGRKCLRIDHHLDLAGQAGSIDFTFSPIIRRRPNGLSAHWTWVRSGLIPQQDQPVGSLQFTFNVAPDRYFILGPGSSDQAAHLLGNVLFADQEGQAYYENLYCVVPMVYRRAGR